VRNGHAALEDALESRLSDSFSPYSSRSGRAVLEDQLADVSSEVTLRLALRKVEPEAQDVLLVAGHVTQESPHEKLFFLPESREELLLFAIVDLSEDLDDRLVALLAFAEQVGPQAPELLEIALGENSARVSASFGLHRVDAIVSESGSKKSPEPRRMPRMSPTKRRTIWVLGTVAVLLVAFASRKPLAEQWYLWSLGSKDATQRTDAFFALGEVRSERAVPKLIEIIRKERRPRTSPLESETFIDLPRPGQQEAAWADERITAYRNDGKHFALYAVYAIGKIGPDAEAALPVWSIGEFQRRRTRANRPLGRRIDFFNGLPDELSQGGWDIRHLFVKVAQFQIRPPKARGPTGLPPPVSKISGTTSTIEGFQR